MFRFWGVHSDEPHFLAAVKDKRVAIDNPPNCDQVSGKGGGKKDQKNR